MSIYRVPYRIDLATPPDDALDSLVTLGALDIEQTVEGIAALMPDAIDVERIRKAVGVATLWVTPAMPRDEGSTWVLTPRPLTVGRLSIAPADVVSPPSTLKLIDSDTFGSGLHPTTILCVVALSDLLDAEMTSSMLDVGTGSGVLALSALRLGVRHAVALDVDPHALRVAAENARINDLAARVDLVHGGPETVDGAWPLVVANILAAPLIEMAPVLVRRVAHGGQLVLSGIAVSVATEVAQTYRRLGMRPLTTTSRSGWAALVLGASW